MLSRPLVVSEAPLRLHASSDDHSGSIEFGEHSKETIQREIMEEIGTAVKDLHYLGMIENIFTYEGHKGHEIVLIYDGSFIDETLYDEEVIDGDELGWPFRAYWMSLSEFGPEKPLYPSLFRRFLRVQRTGI